MKRTTPSHKIRKAIRGRSSSLHPSHESYKWWLLANVMIGTFMAVLDATIVNVGLPKIMAAFGVGIDKIEWVILAYMLAMAIALPTAAWMADRFGYKRMYFWGLLLFTVGSFLCGLSGNENMLILSRVIQGLGAGTIMPLGMAIITREFPPQQRGIAIGFWSIASAASVSFGPLIGGYLIDNFDWQLIFDVNVPVGIIGMIATVVIQREFVSNISRRFDIIGFLAVITFLPLTLYALSQGNAVTNAEGWSAPYILICFGIAAISLVIFITAELTVEHPLIDLRLLSNHNFGISNIIIFIFGIGMFGSTFLLPLYLQNTMGFTAYQSGAVFLPIGIIQGSLAPIIGRISDKTNAKVPLIIGICLLAFSFYINSSMSFLTEHSYIMSSLYIRGLGMGMIFTPISTISLFEVPREKLAQASGLTNVIRQLGGSFGVAILATILSSRMGYHAQMYGGAVQTSSQEYRNVTTNITYNIEKHAGGSYNKAYRQGQYVIMSHLNREAYIHGIDDDFLIASIFTIIGGIPVFFLHSKKKLKKKIQKTS